MKQKETQLLKQQRNSFVKVHCIYLFLLCPSLFPDSKNAVFHDSETQVTDTAVLGHIGKSPLGHEGTRFLDATALSDLWNLQLHEVWGDVWRCLDEVRRKYIGTRENRCSCEQFVGNQFRNQNRENFSWLQAVSLVVKHVVLIKNPLLLVVFPV